jgi:exodeoxyribonuclease V alpha subunit
VNNASHIITVEMNDSGTVVKIDKAGDINSLLLGYCLTIHKSQGSEWRKVFIMLHQSHATMIQRELLYTAVTRAKEELYIICEPDSFVNGIRSQRIKGNTLAEKAEYFKGKVNRDKMEEMQ